VAGGICLIVVVAVLFWYYALGSSYGLSKTYKNEGDSPERKTDVELRKSEGKAETVNPLVTDV
jgi:hypothetical protein